MNKMDQVFSQMKKDGEKILVSYFPIGDSYVADSVGWAKRFLENGTTVLEIGLPYEDPYLDGATVAATMERALKRTNLEAVWAEIGKIRLACPDAVLQIMTYSGNVMKYGIDGFAEKCNECGADAMLIPNATAKEMAQLDQAVEKYGIHNLRFVPYSFGEEVVSDLKQHDAGYVYLQAVDGKTGSSSAITTQIRDNVEVLRQAGVKAPLIPGFGISTAEHVRTYLNMGTDGVIIGSAIINHVIAGDFDTYLKEIRAELDRG